MLLCAVSLCSLNSSGLKNTSSHKGQVYSIFNFNQATLKDASHLEDIILCDYSKQTTC